MIFAKQTKKKKSCFGVESSLRELYKIKKDLLIIVILTRTIRSSNALDESMKFKLENIVSEREGETEREREKERERGRQAKYAR